MENKWMIVKKEKMSTKIKNYFKNIFSKIVNQGKKKKNKSKDLWPRKQEVLEKQHFEQQNERMVEEHKYIEQSNYAEQFQPRKTEHAEPAKINKEITIEVTPTKRKPKEIIIEYENRNKPKKKQIVVEYEEKKKKVQNVKPAREDRPEEEMKKEVRVEKKEKIEKAEAVNNSRIQLETKKINVEVKPTTKKKTIEKKKEEPELALKPVKPKKEKKPLNIFQLFKDKERKKRKEILNRIRENKVDDYETISTKAKLSKGSIAVDDVDAHELDPLIDLYRDSNKKLRNRIKESQK